MVPGGAPVEPAALGGAVVGGCVVVGGGVVSVVGGGVVSVLVGGVVVSVVGGVVSVVAGGVVVSGRDGRVPGNEPEIEPGSVAGNELGRFPPVPHPASRSTGARAITSARRLLRRTMRMGRQRTIGHGPDPEITPTG